MFSSMWNFVKRHKRKIVLTGALVGGVLWLGKFARDKLNDFQDDESAEYLLQARKQHHFDSNQRTCNTTALAMLPTLREVLTHHLDSESLTLQLRTNPANKLEIWEELKIIGFSRTVTAVYVCCVVVVVLRVQLNILGGYMYLDTLPAYTGIKDCTLATPSVQQQYLGTIQCLLGKSLVDLTAAVQGSVKRVLGSTSLKHQMSLSSIQTMIGDIRGQLECSTLSHSHQMSPLSSLCEYVTSTVVENGAPDGAVCLSRDDITLQKLMRETQDVLDSSDFHDVLLTCLDTSFSRLVDRIAEYFKPSSQQNGTIFNPNEVEMPLAKVIPVMSGLLNTMCANTPNPIVQELLLKEPLNNTSLKHQMSLSSIQTMIGDIRGQLECSTLSHSHQMSPLSSLCEYVTSTVVENGAPDGAVCLSRDDITLQKLMRETQDVLDSSDFHDVLLTCLDTSFSRLVDRIAEYFKPSSQQNGTIFNPNEVEMPLAKVIPVMSGLLNTMCANTPNPIVQELLLKEPLNKFAANIYEAFSQTVPTTTGL